MSRRAAWLLGLIVLVLVAGRVASRDVTPAGRTVPGFTLYAVDADGARERVAQFDGRRWRPPCEAGWIPRAMTRLSIAPIVAIEASSDTPLSPVEEVPRGAEVWRAAWPPLVAAAGVVLDDTWTHDAHVYVESGSRPRVAYVDILLRRGAAGWTGMWIGGWVALGTGEASRLDADVRPFASYDAYMALDRPIPLGVVRNTATGATEWVMRTTGRTDEQITVVQLDARATELLRVPRAGCS